MKAYIRPINQISKKQREAIRKVTEEQLKLDRQGLTRRLFKIFCVALNKEYGFGKQRLHHLIGMVQELANERPNDEVFWSHVDRKVIDEIGMDFSREDYDLLDE